MSVCTAPGWDRGPARPGLTTVTDRTGPNRINTICKTMPHSTAENKTPEKTHPRPYRTAHLIPHVTPFPLLAPEPDEAGDDKVQAEHVPGRTDQPRRSSDEELLHRSLHWKRLVGVDA